MVPRQFCCNPNNYENVSHKFTEISKEKAKGKEHNSKGQYIKNSESSSNLSSLHWLLEYKFFKKQI